MNVMNKENAVQIFKQELSLYSEYQRLIKQKKEYKQEQIESRVDVHAISFGDGGASSALTKDEKLAIYCVDTEEIDFAIVALTEMINWINETINRLEPTIRIYTIYHYMLRRSIDQIAEMAGIHPVICRTQIPAALNSVLTEERIKKYNLAKSLLRGVVSENQLERMKNGKAKYAYNHQPKR